MKQEQELLLRCVRLVISSVNGGPSSTDPEIVIL